MKFNAAFQGNAFLRGDLAVAHAWDDREGAPKPPEGAVAIRGRVVDVHGTTPGVRDGHGLDPAIPLIFQR